MPINLGLAPIDKAYLGLAPIDRIYFGNSLLWQAEEEEPILTLKAGTLTNPPVSARLGTLESTSARPFTNQFKTAWEWDSTLGGWGALRAGGHITEGGQIISMPPGGSPEIRTRVLFEAPSQSAATGRWRLRWTGTGTVIVHGAANEDQVSANEIQFEYTANGGSWITVVVAAVNSGPIANFSLVHQDDWADFDAGKIYRRQYLDEIRNARCIRFDEWMGILRSEPYGLIITDWASRPLPTDEMFSRRFVPYEWQCALCTEIGADGWFCMPTAATDDHIEQAATLIRTLMPAPRRVYAELSTKTWDFAGTPQAHYFSSEGRAYFDRDTGQEFLDFYGMQSAICAQIWREVWGDDPRLITVVQTQCDWLGNEWSILNATMWQQAADPGSPYYRPGCPPYVPPHSVIDMLTVHAQVDGGMAYGARASEINTWRTTLTQTEAFNRMRDQMLDGRHFGTSDINQRTILRLTPKWEYFKNIVDSHGMMLGCYEVGNLLNGVGGGSGNEEFIAAYSVSAQIGQVYTATFAAIRAAGMDGPLCMSVECRWPDSNTAHGLQRYLGDHNAAWAAVDAINQLNDGPAGRGANDFVGAYDLA